MLSCRIGERTLLFLVRLYVQIEQTIVMVFLEATLCAATIPLLYFKFTIYQLDHYIYIHLIILTHIFVTKLAKVNGIKG